MDEVRIDDVRRAYRVQAKRYVELFGSTDVVHPDDLAFIDRHLSIVDGPVLDVGCGPGHLTEHLRTSGRDASGIDLVPEFVAHARAAHPHGRYELGSMEQLPVADGSLAGMLAWYSLIHVAPDEFDAVLAELRRALAPAATIVVGFFDGDDVAAFEHRVVTAWFRPADEFSARLHDAGLTEIDRSRRPAGNGHRAHAAIAAIAD